MDDPRKRLQYVNDFEQALKSLTAEDIKAIDLAAFKFAESVAISPDWLVREAIKRTVRGTRKWPPKNDISLRAFLCGVMKSIKNEVCSNLPGAIECHYTQLKSHPVPPEEEIIIKEREAWAQQVIESAFDHFSNDENVLKYLMGKAEGLTGEEIRKQEGMTQNQYNAAQKRLSRYRNANYPRGNRNE